jgi:hypothetical protein
VGQPTYIVIEKRGDLREILMVKLLKVSANIALD